MPDFYSQTSPMTRVGRFILGVTTLSLGLFPLIATLVGFLPAETLPSVLFWIWTCLGTFAGLWTLLTIRKPWPVRFVQLTQDSLAWGKVGGKTENIPTANIEKIRMLIDDEDHELRVTIFKVGDGKIRFPVLFDEVLLPREEFLGSASDRYKLSATREELYKFIRTHHPRIQVELKGHVPWDPSV